MAATSAALKKQPNSKGQAWFCTTGLPSDIVIEVEDMSFHLHKFPVMSRSKKLHNLITEQEQAAAKPDISATKQNTQTTSSKSHQQEEPEEEDDDETEEYQCQIVLSDFPGGSDTFEMAAKFCYGVKIDLTSSNVALIRCAGEFLEMTEEYSADNLISKTERFLSHSVLKSLKESIKTLKSCEQVMPLAETLGITQRCIISIASRAPSADPTLFSWPMSDEVALNGAPDSLEAKTLWNEIKAGARRKSAVTKGNNVHNSWFEDLALLSLNLFKRLIFALRDQDLNSEVVESCLMYYAKKNIPGVSRSGKKPSSSSSSSSSIASENQQRELLETIISYLPLEKRSGSLSSTTTKFLFGLLRTANILNASEVCRAAMEKKIGSQLEQATLDDLLIPSYSYLNETLYDVDCVERILAYFLDGLEEEKNVAAEGIEAEINITGENTKSPDLTPVGKLIDGYLSEIASDANLKPDKFYNLALSLPEQARLFDDGLYRAVDVYLKTHPWVSEAEREKICGAMDFQKLTLEACTHAAQNERLPLRAVVQVLFFEQLQLRHAIAGTLLAADSGTPDLSRASAVTPRTQHGEEHEDEEVEGEKAGAEFTGHVSSTWKATVRENQVLRLDMDSMRTRVNQLERECSTIKKVIEKIDDGNKVKGGPKGINGGGKRRESFSRKFGCKFKTQVCDSHESTVVEKRKGRHPNHHRQ